MEGAMTEKDINLRKQKNINKGQGKLAANKSEKQLPRITDEERKKLEEARAIQRKLRKNNGARRNDHPEMEVVEHTVYPDDPKFDINKAHIIGQKDANGEYPYRVSVRYECIPMRFVKHIYKIYTYTQDGTPYEGKAPKAAFLKKATSLVENFYKAIRDTVLRDDYIGVDETYYKILVPEKNAKGKGVKKGYFWVIIGVKINLCTL